MSPIFDEEPFRYGPSHWEVLAEVMRRKLAFKNQSLASYVDQRVMAAIGLNSSNWRSDSLGVPYFSTGTILSITQLGRLGQMLGQLLAGRNAEGFSAEHFSAMARPSAANPMFGGGIWRNSQVHRPNAKALEVEHAIDRPLDPSAWSRSCLSTRQPESMVALIGSGGKRVYIWPAERRRIARLASSTRWSDATFLAAVPVRSD
jgi:hypothetical protein